MGKRLSGKLMCAAMLCIFVCMFLTSCGGKKEQPLYIKGEKVFHQDNLYKFTEEVFVTNDKIKVITALPGFVTEKGPIKVIKLFRKDTGRNLYLFPDKNLYCTVPTEFNEWFMMHLRGSVNALPQMDRKETVAGYECTFYGPPGTSPGANGFVSQELQGLGIVTNVVEVQMSELPDSFKQSLKSFNCVPLKVNCMLRAFPLFSFVAKEVRIGPLEKGVFEMPAGYTESTFEEILEAF